MGQVWSLSAEGEPQHGGQAQGPWSQRRPRESIKASVLSSPSPAIYSYPRGAHLLSQIILLGSLFCLVTAIVLWGKKSGFQTSLSQAIPRNNFYHFAISRQKQIRETKGQVALCLINIFLFF